MKIKNNLKSGAFAVLPIVIFFFILRWFFYILFGISNNFLLLLPKHWIYDSDSTIPFYWHLTAIIFISFFLWGIGVLVNHYYVGNKLRKFAQPMVKKIPILNSLFRISKQVNDTLVNKDSFKKVVLIELFNGSYSVAFIARDNMESFENANDDRWVSIFDPTSPNPSNGFSIMRRKRDIIDTDIPVPDAIEYIISMGTIDIGLEKYLPK